MFSHYYWTIAIDPGFSGAIAYKNIDGLYGSILLSRDEDANYEALHEFHPPSICFMEKVGNHRRGNNAMASVTFAKHCEALTRDLSILNIPCNEIAPQTWMGYLGALTRGTKINGETEKEKESRTRYSPLLLDGACSNRFIHLWWARFAWLGPQRLPPRPGTSQTQS